MRQRFSLSFYFSSLPLHSRFPSRLCCGVGKDGDDRLNILLSVDVAADDWLEILVSVDVAADACLKLFILRMRMSMGILTY